MLHAFQALQNPCTGLGNSHEKSFPVFIPQCYTPTIHYQIQAAAKLHSWEIIPRMKYHHFPHKPWKLGLIFTHSINKLSNGNIHKPRIILKHNGGIIIANTEQIQNEWGGGERHPDRMCWSKEKGPTGFSEVGSAISYSCWLFKCSFKSNY